MPVVPLPSIQIPPFLSGKGSEYFFAREAYIIQQLNDYVKRREARLIRSRARGIVAGTIPNAALTYNNDAA